MSTTPPTDPIPQSVQHKLARLERELEAARRISLTLFQHLNIRDLVEKSLGIALEVVGAEAGSVLLANPETQQLVFSYSIGVSRVPVGTTIAWNQGIAGSVYQSGNPEIIPDVDADPRHLPSIDYITGYKTRELIAIPLKRWEGEPIGVMEVLNKVQGRLNHDDIAILTIISAFTAISIEEARLFEEAKLAEVARLLGDIGHDVKNMLMPVITGAGLLQEELNDFFSTLPEDVNTSKSSATQEMCREVIDMLRNNGLRIQDRVREISDCVKGRSTPPKFSLCMLKDIVGIVVQTLRFLAEEKGISLRIEGLDSLPAIQADSHRLFNAFYNLINNAIPEVPSGGSITTFGKVNSDEQMIHVQIVDTGRGMTPEVRDSLFTNRVISQKVGGTGLGTKIVKDVIDVHRGSIHVESEIGVGTTFYITLPIGGPDDSPGS